MPHDRIFYRAYGDAGYVLNMQSGRSYYFENVGAAVLDAALQGEKNPARIAEKLAQEYDIPSLDTVQKDVESFLRILEKEGLLSGPETPRSALPEDYLVNYCRANYKLDVVMLELTYRCNERCVHCYTCDAVKDERRELSTDNYRRIMDELRAFGVNELVFSGGEIGLRKDFTEIYQYAIEKEFLVTLMTNGTQFCDDQMEMLYTYPPKIVYISFYGGCAETHDAVTGVKGSFRKSLDTLMRLKCAGVMVGMKTVAMKPTLGDFEGIVKLAERLRVGLGTGMYITCGNNGSKEPANFRLTEDRDYDAIIEAKQSYTKAYTPYRVRDPKGEICEVGTMGCNINPYGDYYVCTSLPVPCGNILETPIEEFWYRNDFLNKIRSLRFSDTDCGDCLYKNECVYCIGANYVETGNLFAVQKEHCQAAQSFYRYYQREKEASASG